MPPKNAKKQAIARPDNSGIPKQDIQFKFSFNVKSEATELPFAIMFEWFGSTSQKTERVDSTVIQSWQKTEDVFSFEKAFDAIRVDDDFCKTLSQKRFYLYFVNGEDNKVEDTLLLDYSSLLMFKGQEIEPTFTFQSPTIKIMDIDLFSIKVTANKELIQDLYRHYLNPFEVEVIGAKDVPIDNTSKYQPSYIRYSFFDGVQVETHPIVGKDKLIWNHKHVFLAGLMNSVELKEKMRSSYMKFELHDRDEVQNKKLKEDTPLFDLTKAIEEEMEKQKPVEEDPKKKGGKKEEKKEVKKQAKKDPKKKDVKLGQPILPQKVDYFQNNYGIAAFYLVDFLKPSLRTSKYKAPVVPKNTFEDFQSRNIDLNTTARNEMQKIIASNNYFEQDTQLAVGFTISSTIGTFKKPEQAEEPVEEVKKGKKQVVEQKVEKKDEEEKKKDVFERVVYIVPYKDAETVEKIENLFYEVNMNAFGLKNKRQISTCLLKNEDKSSTQIDYMTGIQLIDADGRIYIIQGLKDGAMKKIHQIMVKLSVNTKTFKILKNSNLTFTKRLYPQFNLQLKRIRFRPSLTQILLDPSIYIKSKVPEQICNNLNRVSELRKLCDDLKTVDSMNLWPSSDVLIQIQRKFSDSLSHLDIYGVEEPPKRKKADLQVEQKEQKTMNLMQNGNLLHVTGEQFSLPKINAGNTGDMGQTMENEGNTRLKKNIITKIFTKDEMKNMKTYDMRLKKQTTSENQPVFIYGGQKNNWYEKQKRDLRQKIQNQKGKYIYTYSNEHLGLSIDPKTLDDEAKREKLFSESLNYSHEKFSSLIIKTKDERMRLAKRPGDEDIEDLKNYPYYEQKQREKQLKKNPRDMPLHNDKAEFQKYIRKPDYFSQPKVVAGEKIGLAEQQQLEKQKRKRQQEQSRKKMFGNPEMKIKKGYYSDAVIGPDKFKDILEGQPAKKGFIDVNKKTKEKRPVKQYEVSYELNEKRINPSFNPLIRRDDPTLNVNEKQFNNYQRPQVLTLTSVAKPLNRGDV